MANTLNGLIPIIYDALHVVSREQVGFIPAVSRDPSIDMVAKGQTVRSPIAPAAQAEDIEAGPQPANTGDNDFEYFETTITKSRAVPIKWNGEEQLSAGSNASILLGQQFQEAFRTLTNEQEADLAALYVMAARAYGTAGTTPFNTADDLTDLSEVNRILDENGAPSGTRSMILGSAARARLEGKQPSLFKVNEAGGNEFARTRAMPILQNLAVGSSAQVKRHTAGNAADFQTSAVEPAGETSIAVTGGTGDFNAGDLVTFAGDDRKFIASGALSGGVLTLNKPGAVDGVGTGVAVTRGGAYAANMGFSRDALLLATRAPAMPQGGDAADDVTTVTDPLSGISYQIAVYRQYRQIKIEVGVAWGVAAPNPRHLALLLG
jgi:hypothetical protein